jgi:hypothetical protein
MKRLFQEESLRDSPSASTLDLAKFPALPEHARPREVYFNTAMSTLDEEALRARGYAPVQLITLPRRNDQEQGIYFLKKLQGLEEGTCEGGEEERMRARLGMEAYGLLNNKSVRLNLNVDVKTTDIKALLTFGQDRHTLRTNTTIVSQEMTAAQVNDNIISAELKLEDKRKETHAKLLAQGVEDTPKKLRKTKRIKEHK